MKTTYSTEQKVLGRWPVPGAKALVLMAILLLVQGCQNQGTPAANGRQNGVLTGNLAAPAGTTLVVKNIAGETREITLGKTGTFAVALPPGTYKVLARTASGSLNLVKQSVLIEENMTVNLLEVSLVPRPQIVSVSVPQVYADSAVVVWETDIESDGRVDYGREASYGYSTFTTTELSKQHRMQIFGLNPETPYHFRVVSSRHGLEELETFSSDFSFTTDSEKK
jgi:hypothetical protein